MVDYTWPHQVAIHGEICRYDLFHPLHKLARQLGASPRARIVMKHEPHGYDQRYNLFCFSRREDAQTFIDRFGGEHFNPTTDRHPPRSRNGRWTKSDWGVPAERYAEIVTRLEWVKSWEPPLDADIAMLLGIRQKCVRFTRSHEEVQAFLAGRIPAGSWETQIHPHYDARVRIAPDDAWRAACENTTPPRDCLATALTLAFLRALAPLFVLGTPES